MSSHKNNKTKNDLAWETIFEKYAVLDEIAEKGFFEIDAITINQFRESRLMAKFDHEINLPQIFKDNSLSILPISRSRYIIGHFNTYFKVNYAPEIEPITVTFPSSLESLDYETLSSESLALNCAFHSGIISDILETEFNEVFQTVSGRMSTGHFDFYINNKKNKKPNQIEVNNSQCEIDAAFESQEYFLIVEAKMSQVEDFLIRQLYYPYRLWSNKLRKKVRIALMTYSNSTNQFSFFLYNFENSSDYNSIKLIQKKNYIISPEEITRDDISQVFNSLEKVDEPKVTLPQADKFDRMVDLLTLLHESELTKEEITMNYQFVGRQTNYYTTAAKYLGLVDSYKKSGTREIIFYLTDTGKDIMSQKYKQKILSLIETILKYPVFYQTFEMIMNQGEIPTRDEICEILSHLNLNDTTKDRRSRTVRSWMKWIFEICSD